MTHGTSDPKTKELVLSRLKSVEGHLRGVTKMVAEEEYCIDVLRQTKAIHSALAKIETLLLERHLNSCVLTALRADDVRTRNRLLRELLDVFETGKKP